MSELGQTQNTFESDNMNAFDDVGVSNQTAAAEFSTANLELCVEYLNTLFFPNAPPHKLCLTVGMMVLIIRNLDPLEKLMNGVFLVSLELQICISLIHLSSYFRELHLFAVMVQLTRRTLQYVNSLYGHALLCPCTNHKQRRCIVLSSISAAICSNTDSCMSR